MLDSLFTLDVRTLMVVLFLGNIASVALIVSYYWNSDQSRDTRISNYYLAAKSLQACAYLCLMSRELVPDIISVNLGNTFILLGFYCEAVAMLAIIQENGFSERLLTGITLCCIVAFNCVEFIKPDTSLRVAVASLCLFLILIIPNIRLFVSENSTRFKKWIGVFYLCLLVMLLPRAFYAFMTDMNILTNSPIQAMTFLSLVLLLIFSLSAYLLLVKEKSDRIIAAMASTDYLTGLSNRYSFFDAAQRSFARMKHDGKSVAILFLDIDYFKNINDTYGHSFGDTVLVALGRIMRETVRPSDLTCRYGGEEFIVMLPDATRVTALKVAERIRAVIRKAEFPDYPDFSFCVSIGLADGIPESDDSLELFIDRADSALYTAKKSGRDQIAEYDPISTFLSDI